MTGYVLQVSADGGTTWSVLATITTNAYSHTGLNPGTTRHYRVKAEERGGRHPVVGGGFGDHAGGGRAGGADRPRGVG